MCAKKAPDNQTYTLKLHSWRDLDVNVQQRKSFLERVNNEHF